MSYLLDAPTMAEMRRGESTNPGLRAWLTTVEDNQLYVSVLSIGAIRRGAERIRARDAKAARALERWLHTLLTEHNDRVLAVDESVVEMWAEITADNDARGPSTSEIDALVAATALAYELTIVTPHPERFSPWGVQTFSPFSSFSRQDIGALPGAPIPEPEPT